MTDDQRIRSSDEEMAVLHEPNVLPRDPRSWLRTIVSLAVLILIAGLAGLYGPRLRVPQPARADAVLPTFSHVMVILLENRSYSQIVGSASAPFVNTVLIPQYASATNLYATQHNSPTSYFGLSSGRSYAGGDGGSWAGWCTPITSTCMTADTSIYTQLASSGRSWKIYSEGQSTPCQTTSDNTTKYWVGHNPAPYYTQLGPNSSGLGAGDGSCGRNDVDYSVFKSDLAAGTVPSLAYLIPDNCDNMHDSCYPTYDSVKQGDSWLQSQLVGDGAVAGGLLAWAQAHDTLLLITFDEGDATDTAYCCPPASSGGGGHIPLWVAGPGAKVKSGGYQGSVNYNLYSLFKALEENWGLPLLYHAADGTVSDLSDFLISGNTNATTPTPVAPAPTETPTATPPPSPTQTATATTTAVLVPTGTATSTPSVAISCPADGASPATVAPGASETFTTTVTAGQMLTATTVSFEVYAGLTQVGKTYDTGLTLNAATPQTISATWAVPALMASGTYTVKVLVFGPNWEPLYAIQFACSSFAVAAALSTNTPTAAATAPVTPPSSTPPPTDTAMATPSSTPVETALSTPTAPAGNGTASIKTVFLIVLENENWANIKGNPAAPYINGTLLPMASHAERYYNPPGLHPSLPDYLWLEAGTNFGITDDKSPRSHPLTTTSHLTTLLSKAGLSWKAYEENISGTTCPLSDSYPYAVRHNPFVYFTDVTTNLSSSSSYCIAHVRPYTELATDLQNNTVARYTFITPNVCDDGHDACAPLNNPVQQTDTWLSTAVPPILASAAYQSGGALFITWDEGEGSDGPIGLIVLSPAAKGGGYANTVPYTHSATLRTLEEIFGVGPWLGDAANAPDLRDLFTTFP